MREVILLHPTDSVCVAARDLSAGATVELLEERLHLRNDGYACFGGAPQDLPGVAEFDAGNVGIPCGWWVGAAERERIVECIRSGW